MPRPNKWRYVKDGSDGESTYSCLACKAFWVACTSPAGWTFCPYCGTRWDVEHKCRPQYMPRWEWDRYGEKGRPNRYGNYDWQELARKKQLERVWLIQVRSKWDGSDWSDWKTEDLVHYLRHSDGLGMAQYVKDILTQYREAHPDTDEDGKPDFIIWQYRTVGVRYRKDC